MSSAQSPGASPPSSPYLGAYYPSPTSPHPSSSPQRASPDATLVPCPAAPPITRTIDIRGFPDDVRDRELNNLLLFLPGYQASVLLTEGGKKTGRATFCTVAHARDAINRLSGAVFDVGAVLKALPAPKDLDVDAMNTEPTKSVQHGRGNEAHKEKREKDRDDDDEEDEDAGTASGDEARQSSAGSDRERGRATTRHQQREQQQHRHVPATHPSHSPVHHHHHQLVAAYHHANSGLMPYATPFQYAPMPAALMNTGGSGGSGNVRSYAAVKNEKDNPPCNTLFIGNLGGDVDEEELQSAFESQPGFQQIKVVHGPRGISAFIEFIDVAAAAAAHDSQQGLILASSDRGPIRVQYSKNPFGRKRDGSGGGSSGVLSSGVLSSGGGASAMTGGSGGIGGIGSGALTSPSGSLQAPTVAVPHAAAPMYGAAYAMPYGHVVYGITAPPHHHHHGMAMYQQQLPHPPPPPPPYDE